MFMAAAPGKSKMELRYFNLCCIYWTLLMLAVFLIQEVSMVRLASLRIPKYTIRGQPVRLECHYDLENEALYSVKWYKDGKEFYRFMPGDNPPAQTFDQPGFTVDVSNSTDNTVVLQNVDLDGSGLYRCEVSGEAPAFETVLGSGPMMVVDLPDAGPQIEGGSLSYSLEDVVRVNCTSPRAKPAAKLIWHINGDVADDKFLRRYTTFVEENGLETSILGLQFKVKRQHLKGKGGLKIKCVAKIEDFYWRTNEENILQYYPARSPALERVSDVSSSTYQRNAVTVSYYCSILVVFVISRNHYFVQY